jgi:hypothetical protein
MLCFIAILFLEFWKRKHACVAYEWHINDYEREVNSMITIT